MLHIRPGLYSHHRLRVLFADFDKVVGRIASYDSLLFFLYRPNTAPVLMAHFGVSDLRLYMLQRLSALVMAPLVLGHLAVMIYAVQGGLSTGEILSRTSGSLWWLAFYGSFVIAVSIHAAIGLRVITHEMTGLRGAGLGLFTWVVGLGLLWLGGRAVLAVTLA